MAVWNFQEHGEEKVRLQTVRGFHSNLSINLNLEITGKLGERYLLIVDPRVETEIRSSCATVIQRSEQT